MLDEQRRKQKECKELEKIKKLEELQTKTEENFLKEQAILEERKKILDQKEKERIQVSLFILKYLIDIFFTSLLIGKNNK